MPTCFTFVWQVLYVYAKDGDLSFHLLCGMAARDADVALMRRMGICPRGEVKKLFSDFDERTVLVAWPPQERLPRLQWSGWDAVYTCGWHALAALPSVAAAVHSLRRLKLYYWPASEPPAAVAEVLGTHPIERLHIEVCCPAALATSAADIKAAGRDAAGRHRTYPRSMGGGVARPPLRQGTDLACSMWWMGGAHRQGTGC